MEIALVFAVGAISIISFVIGAKVGQKVSKGEDIEIPSVNPSRIARNMRERKEEKAEQSKIETIMRNIESYDGTSNGQVEVPRR